MKKITLSAISLLIISCRADQTDFTGTWLDKKTELQTLTIVKNGDHFITEYKGKKYPSQVKEEMLEINFNTPLKASINIETNVLILDGEEYIRKENQMRPQFEGRWDEIYYMDYGEKIKSDKEYLSGLSFGFEENGDVVLFSYDKFSEYGKIIDRTIFENGRIISKFDGIDPHLLEPITTITTYKIENNGLLSVDKGYGIVVYYEKRQETE